jgi:hypothetical protein
MWTPSKRTILLAAALLLASTLARSDGLTPSGGLASGFTGGISRFGAVAPPATPCSGTGLIFTVACNSQYIGII